MTTLSRGLSRPYIARLRSLEFIPYNIMATGHGPRNDLENRPKRDGGRSRPPKKVGVTNTEQCRTPIFFGIHRVTDNL